MSLVEEAEQEAIRESAHLKGLRPGDEIKNTRSGARGMSADVLNRSYRRLRVIVMTPNGKRRYRQWTVKDIARV